MEKEEKMGKVQYYLRENPLSTGDENKFMASVRRKEVLRHDQIVTLMTRKNTTISREEIEMVLNLQKQIVKQQILAGYPVIMDLFKAQVSIKGGFTDGDDEFDGRRHYVNVSMSANCRFKKELAEEALIERVAQVEERTRILQLFNYNTRSFSHEFPPGGLVSLKGRNLQPDEGDPQVILRREGADEDVPVTDIYKATDREIMFNLPADLEAGDYRIKLYLEKGLVKKEIEYGELIAIG